jgi:hypothetical protein
MKTLIILLLLAATGQDSAFQERRIKSITVYKIEGGKTRFIGMNEYTIRNSVSATKHEVVRAQCLKMVESNLKNLVEAKSIQAIGSIYALCVVHYTDASEQTIAFEEVSRGYIKFGTRVYYHSAPLTSSILFCQ